MDAEREALRRQYLSALDIKPWYSRHRFPLGLDLDWPELPDGVNRAALAEPSSSSETAPASASTVPNPAAAPVPAEGTAATLLDRASQQARAETGSAPVETAAENEAQAEPTPPATALETGQGIEFKQRWWAHEGWLIVDTRAAGMQPEQQRQADRLVAALAQTLCGQRKPTLAYRIDWPLFVNRSIKHDVEEARFYLQQKWQAVQQQSPVRYLLMLGEQTPELLGMTPETPGDVTWKKGDIACCCGPATSEMLHLPAAKQQFWRHLRPWLAEL